MKTLLLLLTVFLISCGDCSREREKENARHVRAMWRCHACVKDTTQATWVYFTPRYSVEIPQMQIEVIDTCVVHRR